MKTALLRYSIEWRCPSILLLRIGGPFVAGMFSLQPELQLEDDVKNPETVRSPDGKSARVVSSLSHIKRIRAVRISLFSALKSVLFSMARHVTSRLFAIGISCGILQWLPGQFWSDAAFLGESAERRDTFCLASAARIALAPVLGKESASRLVCGAVLLPTVDADDVRSLSRDFSAEITSPAQFASKVFTRALITQSAVGLSDELLVRVSHMYVMRLRPLTHDAVYECTASFERFGISPRSWMKRLKIFKSVGHVFGAAIGAGVAAALSRNYRLRNSNLDASVVVLLCGELLGAALGRAVAHLLFGRFGMNPDTLLIDEIHSMRATGQILTNRTAQQQQEEQLEKMAAATAET